MAQDEISSLTVSSPAPEQLVGQNAKIDVSLKGVAETLIIPLAARAFDASAAKPILGDPYAKDVLDKLDYDFDKAALPPYQAAGVAVRARQFDRWIISFLAAHPRSTVLHLACGLDSRSQRLDWRDEVRWIDVDLPEVIALRRQVLPESLPGREYQLVAASVTDESWLEDIPADRPTAVVMEGLLSYLMEDDVKALLSRLVNHLREGELMFECVNPTVLSSLRKGHVEAVERTGAEFHWAVEDPKELEDVHPHLKLLETLRFFEAPGVENFPLITRATMYILSWIPSVRDSARFLRFKFSPEVSV